ncbi:hypothetical protein BBJ28_00017594 [Nothophytophthora sp. Chile5]|nr:hypothetical protein BBJ28_00017594 [Nothophytophthora sp. Chile5]
MLVATVDAPELALFYRTSWERNCVKNAFAAAGFSRTRKKWSGWHLAWAKHVQRTQFQQFRGDHMQVFNHFPDPWVIGRKDRLMKTLANCRRRFGTSYDFFPEGFALPEQLDAFQRALERNEAFIAGLGTEGKEKAEAVTGPLWIVKPPASACGRGIRVLSHRAACRMCEDVKKDAKKLRQGKKPKPRIVQKYVANPLLLGDGGRFKFDLRLYVAVTSMDPLRIYLFQEGITRFCTAPYSLQNPSNRFAHLTNYAINKASAGFVENADAYSADAGSKWSLEALLRSLKTQGLLENPETLMTEIRAIVCKTVIAAESHLTPLTHQFTGKKTACFELFGFDLMLDAKLRPWLIEVNVSPSLMGGSPLDRRVKGLLLSDICHLVGLQVPLASVPRDRLPLELQSRASASAVSSASSSSSASTPTSRPLRRSKTMRTTPQNRQLHELVLDSTVERFDATHLSLFAASDWDIVRAMDDEMDRRGHFDRIFPASTAAETAVYTRFFTCQRYANALCAKWLQTPRAVRLRLRRQQTFNGRPALSEAVQARRSLLISPGR